jgi:hypothetical protein
MRPSGIRLPARHRGQSGISLVELLLVLLLTGMLFGPLTAWWILATQSQPQIQADAGSVASRALVSQYLVRDIAVAAGAAHNEAAVDAAIAGAGGVNFNFENCRGLSSSNGDVKLVLVRGGLDQFTKTVYSEKVSGGVATLWRQTCVTDVPVALENSAEVQLADELQPGSTATCTAGEDGSICRTVSLQYTPIDADPVVVRGTRRVDVATLGSGASGARAPIAKITVASQTAERPYVVNFSPLTSSDPDGDILCYQWSFTTVAEGLVGAPSPAYVTREVDDGIAGSPCPDRVPAAPNEQASTVDLQERTYATSGVYFVELTVTDDSGLSSTDYLRFEIAPRDPIAESRITALGDAPARAGETVFEFDAQWDDPAGGPLEGSRHPDGTIARYVWTLAEGPVGSEVAYRVERTTPDPWYSTLPADMVGFVSVTLTVFDDAQNRRGSFVNTVELSGPTAATTLPPTTTWPPGAHVAPASVRVGGPSPASDTALVRWNAAAQVDRYIVETDIGCGVGTSSFRVVPAGTLSAPLLPAGCIPPPPPETNPPTPVPPQTVRVRIGAQFGAAMSWSPWLDYTVPAQRIDPATLGGGS